jgi:putative exporter of polyketide antibiotics
VPGLPAEDLSVAPLFVLTAIALGLIALGMWRFGERDLRTE